MKSLKTLLISVAACCAIGGGHIHGSSRVRAVAETAVASSVEFVVKNDLKEITRPHLGFYECKKLFFGKKNILRQFKYITVELAADGQMILRYKLKGGKNGESRCEYAYDEKSGEFSVTSEKGLMGLSCDVTLKKGKMTIFSKFGNKNLVMQLDQK